MTTPRHRVGIIGYGLSAKIFHLPFILSTPEFQFTAICQRHPSPSNDASKDYPNIEVFADSTQLIQSPNVDVVILCTPPNTHMALAKKSLEANKHVVVEKPFCPTSKECRELIECAKKNKRTLSVYHNRRWDVDFQTVLALIQRGTLGKVLEFETHFDRWNPSSEPDAGLHEKNLATDGVVFDWGSHLIDQIVFAFGLPKTVTGFLYQRGTRNTNALDEACTIVLRYDEMIATVKCSKWSAESNQLRYWIRGDKGSFRKFHVDQQEEQLLSGMTIDHPDFGKDASSSYGFLSQADGENITCKPFATLEPQTYAAYYRALAKSLTTETPAPVTAEDAFNVIYLVELARQSALSEQTLKVEI